MRVDERPTLAQVIGDGIRTARERNNWTQDQLAGVLRRAGLDLSRSGLAAIERGSGRSLNLGEMALVCSALYISIHDIFDEVGMVRVSDSAVIRGKAIPSLLDGLSVADSDISTPLTRELDAERSRMTSRGEAEQSAARRLGITPETVARVAWSLWGRSLTAERDARVGPDANHAKRGHVTRQLVAQIEDDLRSESEVLQIADHPSHPETTSKSAGYLWRDRSLEAEDDVDTPPESWAEGENVVSLPPELWAEEPGTRRGKKAK